MPYKVERGRLSFQCETTKLPKIPTWSSPWPLKQKLFTQFVSIALLKKKKKNQTLRLEMAITLTL